MLYRPFVLAAALATAMLAGCGGSQPPVGTPDSLARIAIQTRSPYRGESAKNAQAGGLLYLAGIPTSEILSYPGGKLIGTIAQKANAPCVDNAGDVFMPGSGTLLEYHHGATTPFAKVDLGDNLGLACAVDPTTNDVAVILVGSVKGTVVAVFPNASSSPTYYSAEYTPLYCSYDAGGNLFVDGSASSGSLWMAELKSGASSFSSISLNENIDGAPLQVQRDGSQMTVQASTVIYRLSIGESSATVTGKTTLKDSPRNVAASFIYRDRVIEPSFLARRHQFFSNIGIWNYPKGGDPVKSIRRSGKHMRFTGVALSFAQ